MTTSLYRFYDANGRLLYVGISLSIAQRWSEHARGKDWWGDVAQCTVEHFSSRADAAVAELAAIATEDPLHNVVGRKRQQHDLTTIGPFALERLRDGMSLVGLWFHGSPDRKWQGQIMREPWPGTFRVQTYSWADGSPNKRYLVAIADMLNWTFYTSDAAMRENYPAVWAA